MADALDLGSSVLRRKGSSPFTRTTQRADAKRVSPFSLQYCYLFFTNKLKTFRKKDVHDIKKLHAHPFLYQHCRLFFLRQPLRYHDILARKFAIPAFHVLSLNSNSIFSINHIHFGDDRLLMLK